MDMMSVRRQDTGDCSFPPPFLQSGALGKGIPLMMIEILSLPLSSCQSFFDRINNICRYADRVEGSWLSKTGSKGCLRVFWKSIGYVEHE